MSNLQHRYERPPANVISWADSTFKGDDAENWPRDLRAQQLPAAA